MKYVAKIATTSPFSLVTDMGILVRKHIKDADTFIYESTKGEFRSLYARKTGWKNGRMDQHRLDVSPKTIAKIRDTMVSIHGPKTVEKYLAFPA